MDDHLTRQVADIDRRMAKAADTVEFIRLSQLRTALLSNAAHRGTTRRQLHMRAHDRIGEPA